MAGSVHDVNNIARISIYKLMEYLNGERLYQCIQEKGYTSHDVVAENEGILNRKIGHTGTLDPMAEGVLPWRVSETAPKLCDLPANRTKTYRAVLCWASRPLRGIRRRDARRSIRWR